MLHKNKFRAKAVEQGLTLKEIAEKTKMSEVSLYRKTNGFSEFTRKELLDLAKVLDINANDFMDIFFPNYLTETQEVQ